MTRTSVVGPRGELPQGTEKRRAVEAMFDRVAPGYDRMNRIISLGLDTRWRRRTITALGLPPGARVLDLACGTGDFSADLESGGHRPIGVDLSAGMLAAAGAGTPLARADAAHLPFRDQAFDAVVCGFALRNFVELGAVLRECARVLRPGGAVGALDAAVPERALLRAGNAVWFRGAVPLLGRLLSRDPEAYRYLPASTAYLPGPEDLVELFRASGFESVLRTTMTGGSVQLVVGSRR
ncbi:MAG TPA: ubiquinone/menaquinone biosynthesis methyltransferase [Acidimicrobiia bacterium]|nr:ubiquinone/menaquinone biosynthesis methyltransferase [Acidimicrobiia bacterium]